MENIIILPFIKLKKVCFIEKALYILKTHPKDRTSIVSGGVEVRTNDQCASCAASFL
jgi:hypothetical protein